MISLYECVYEIKKATGWSQEQISIETGLALSTIGRIFRVPGYVGNDISNRLIKQLHQAVVNSPFPKEVEELFYYYDECRERYSKHEFAKQVETLKYLLKNHKLIDSNDLAASRICWLVGHIYFDQAFYLKKGNIFQYAQAALTWYQQALHILTAYEENGLTVPRYKLQQCIISTQFNCKDPMTRAHDEEIQCWLLELNYIQLVEQVVAEDSWNWEAARNGLVAASILTDWDKCWFFWEKMKIINKNFSQLNFAPIGLPAIKKDPDLIWFVKQVSKR